MNRKQKNILCILACVTLVFGGLNFILPNLLSPAADHFSATDWSYEDISGVRVIRSGGALDFIRAGSEKWRLADDPSFEVDHNRAVTLVNNSRYLSIRETLQNAGPPAQYGLDAPEYSVEIRLTNGESKIFDIGAQTVDRRGRFAVERGDSSVFIIQDYADAVFSLSREDFLNRKPRQISWPQALSINISANGKFKISMGRGSDSEPMTLREPACGYINSQSLEELYQRMERFSFSGFVCYVNTPGELSGFGLDDPALIMTASDGDGSFGIMLGDRSPDGRIYGIRAEAPDVVFTAEYADVEWLFLQSGTSFVSSYLFYGDERYAAESHGDIEIVLEGQTSGIFAVKPDGEDFVFTLNGKDFPEEKARQVVVDFLDLKIAGMCEREKIGEPLFSVRARMSGLLVTQCTFYEYDRQFYAVDQGLGVYYLTGRDRIDEFINLLT